MPRVRIPEGMRVASRRAVLLLIVLIGLVGFGGLMLALAFRPRVGPSLSHAVLSFEVPGELQESLAPTSGFPFGGFTRDRPTLWDVVRGLRHAAEDDRVEALVLHIDDIDWGWAKVAEVREAILAFRASGKPVIATLAGGGEIEYFLASAADRITSPPLAILQLDGLSASALFMRGAFDKLDVRPNFSHVGQYKSGVEGYTRTEMSQPAREALQAVVDDLFQIVSDSLAVTLGVPADSVARLLDRGPFLAGDALSAHLIDTLQYAADVESMVVRQGHAHRDVESFRRYIDRMPEVDAGTRIALITAEGEIMSGESYESPTGDRVLGEETIIEALRDASDRSSIEAIVLRIDSPGGSADASDHIWHEVVRAAKKKPLIVSMSDLAASGGYYIAAGADSIVAHPGTLTGSIGVYGGKFNILGLYHKLGLNVETVSRGRNAQMLSPYRDFTPEEGARFNSQMEATYRTFVSRVSEGRHVEPAWVDSVGQGRVWSGLRGRDNRLVDALGGLERAFAMARARADLDPDEPLAVEVYPRVERTFFERMMSTMFGENEDETLLRSLGSVPGMRALARASRFPVGVVLAMLPYHIVIR